MKTAVDPYLIEELLKQTEEELSKLEPVEIMVVGKTGVGKSTLINHIFRENLATTGIGKPVTEHIRHITKKGVPVALYDTRGLELDPQALESIRREILETLEQKLAKQEALHLVYYCINANSARIEDFEIDLIREMAAYVPVMIVLTQSISTQADELKKYIQQLHLPVYAVHAVLAQAYPIYQSVTIPAFGLEELLEKTAEVVPKEALEGLTSAQRVDISQKVKVARKWAKRYILTTFGVGFAPIPFSDATVLVPMQLTMMAHITAVMGVNLDEQTLLSMISVVGGTGGATMAGRFISSSLIKLIPGVGTIAGGVISGTTAATLTIALAYSYIEVLAFKEKSESKGISISKEELTRLFKEKVSGRLERGGQADRGQMDTEASETSSVKRGIKIGKRQQVSTKKKNPLQKIKQLFSMRKKG